MTPRQTRGHGSLRGSAAQLQRNVRRSAPFAAASYTLIGAIIVLGGLGYLADSWLETSPWLLLLGLLLGLVVGFYELATVVWGGRRSGGPPDNETE